MTDDHSRLPRWVKWIVWALSSIVLVIVPAVFALRHFQAEPYPQAETSLRFTEADLPFTHRADLEGSLPFLGSAAIDVDGDGMDELFLGGGSQQADQIFRFSDGEFQAFQTFDKSGDGATHGAVSLDLDADGDTDLLIARESGVWLYENRNGVFEGRNLDLPLAENTTPLSLALGDVNRDGYADLFVSGYLKISLVDGETVFGDGYGGYSGLFLGDENGGWRDVTEAAGLLRQHNSFTAVFVDLDDDRDSDLVVAQDTGVIEIWENLTEMGSQIVDFIAVENPTVDSYPMGLAVGDYDGDGRPDIFASNIGPILPHKLMRGNLSADAPFTSNWYLLKNEGGLRFSDQATAMKADVLGFGWGTVFADLNLDGRNDLVAAQNYVRLPMQAIMRTYPGKVLENRGDQFVPVERDASAANPAYGISPVIADFDGNGAPDIVWANLNGPSKALLSGDPLGNWLTVRLPNTVQSLGAKVTLTTPTGVLIRQVVTSQGMGSDQSRDLIFGLGSTQSVIDIRIDYQNGETLSLLAPAINTMVEVLP